ncbi:MAG: 1-acyl-sn-glycerol-3-phosphate acyltransferase, partial [Chryseobacterium sp.]
MEICLPHYSLEDFKQQIPTLTSVYDFQNVLSRHFVEHFINISTSKVHYTGIENLEQDSSYLFIANHRDIAFDSAMLQSYCFRSGFNTTKIAIGDNLISTPLLVEVARLNKMFLVKRSVTIREKLTNYQLLSEFIRYSLFKEHESVWIAQRDGRTKNGIDKTKQGLVKMLSMGKEKDPIKALRKLKITPLTVSYEFEPCDHLKARELALSEAGPY